MNSFVCFFCTYLTDKLLIKLLRHMVFYLIYLIRCIPPYFQNIFLFLILYFDYFAQNIEILTLKAAIDSNYRSSKKKFVLSVFMIFKRLNNNNNAEPSAQFTCFVQHKFKKINNIILTVNIATSIHYYFSS